MEFIFSISSLQIFIIIFIIPKSIERNETHLFSNNIIILDGYNLRYVNFAQNSEGDLIFYSTAYPNSTLRAFYGLKNNGRPFFKNELYSYSLNSKILQDKFESKILFIKPNNNCNKEYLISVGKINSYVEIYDFDSDTIYEKLINDFSVLDFIQSYRNEGIFLQTNNSGNYYLFGFTSNFYYGENTFYNFSLQIHNFNFQLNNFKSENTSKIIHFLPNAFSVLIGISCFKTKKNYIMCLYLTHNKKFNIIVYDINLKLKQHFYSNIINISTDKPFYKFIHLKEEIGVLSAFINDNTPYLLFVEYKVISDELSPIQKISLENTYNFIMNVTENDLIKLEEDKICFSSAGLDKKKIYYFNKFIRK